MTTESSQLDGLILELGHAFKRDYARRRRRRQLVAVATATAALLMTGVAIAGTLSDWWTGPPPSVVPGEITEFATENGSAGLPLDLTKKATVAETSDARLSAVATKNGGYCLMPSWVGSDERLGGPCVGAPPGGGKPDDSYNFVSTPPGASVDHWIIYGRVLTQHASTIDLRGVGIDDPVQLQPGGFFLADLPKAQWKELDNRIGTYAIRSTDGKVVTNGCVWLGPAPGKPMSGNGYGQFGGPGQSCKPDPFLLNPPQAELQKATPLVTLKLTMRQAGYKPGTEVAIYGAPGSEGTECTFFASVPLSDDPFFSVDNLNTRRAAQCRRPSQWQVVDAIFAPVYGGGSGATKDWLVEGLTKPGSGIVRIEVRAKDGSAVPVAFGDGAFLAELPSSSTDRVPGGPYTITGYDSHGSVVDSVKAAGS